MADEPTSPNSTRISSMLSDLSAQRVPANLPTAVAPIPRPSAPAPLAPRPAPMPAPAPLPPRPQTPPISVPPPAVPSAPVSGAQGEPYTSELRTMSGDIGRISTGQPLASTRSTPVRPPAAPVAPTPPPTPSSPSISSSPPSIPVTPRAPVIPPSVPLVISAPPSSGSSIVRKIFIFLIILAAIGIVFWLVSMVFSGTSTTQPTPTPTPTSSATLAPTTKTITSYFRQSAKTIELKADGSALTDLRNTITTSQPAAQQAVRITVTGPFATSLADLLNAVSSGTIPTTLKSALGSDWAVLVFGQNEQFDANGQGTTASNPQPRTVFISEVADASAATQTLQQWQAGTMVNNLQGIFNYDLAKKTGTDFSTGTYRQIPISYENFPYADMSVDWAIVTASNNKNYLVLSSSRQSMFFVIDQLMQ